MNHGAAHRRGQRLKDLGERMNCKKVCGVRVFAPIAPLFITIGLKKMGSVYRRPIGRVCK